MELENKFNHNILINPVTLDDLERLPKPNEIFNEENFNQEKITSFLREISITNVAWFNVICTSSDEPVKITWWKNLGSDFYKNVINAKSWREVFTIIRGTRIDSKKCMSFMSSNKILSYGIYLSLGSEDMKLNQFLFDYRQLVPYFSPKEKADVWDFADHSNVMLLKAKPYIWGPGSDFLNRLAYFFKGDKLNLITAKFYDNDFNQMLDKSKDILGDFLLTMSADEIRDFYPSNIIETLVDKKIISGKTRLKNTTEVMNLTICAILRKLVEERKIKSFDIKNIMDENSNIKRRVFEIVYLNGKQEKVFVSLKRTSEIILFSETYDVKLLSYNTLNGNIYHIGYE